MRFLVFILFTAAFFISSCSPKALHRRLPGVWSVEHYEEFGPGGYSTRHAMDGVGRLAFRKDKSGSKILSGGVPAGRFGRLQNFSWSAGDSVVTISGPDSANKEIWLVTKNYPTSMVWVTVEGDSQRVMYLIKR